MTGIFATADDTIRITPGNLHELVRGHEQGFLNEMGPMVRQHTITLDLGRVERIDAAGIAALISLYSGAQVAGHHFTVANASPRVTEILSLVGLDRILISHNEEPCPQSEPCFERPAA